MCCKLHRAGSAASVKAQLDWTHWSCASLNCQRIAESLRHAFCQIVESRSESARFGAIRSTLEQMSRVPTTLRLMVTDSLCHSDRLTVANKLPPCPGSRVRPLPPAVTGPAAKEITGLKRVQLTTNYTCSSCHC